MARHGADFELLTDDQLMARGPQFHLRGDEEAIYQHQSGIVDARRANAVHVALARAHGARILDDCPVLGLRPRGERVEVVTAEETYLADRVVITADAWTNQLLAGLGQHLSVHDPTGSEPRPRHRARPPQRVGGHRSGATPTSSPASSVRSWPTWPCTERPNIPSTPSPSTARP